MNQIINLSECCRTCLRREKPFTSFQQQDTDNIKFVEKLIACIHEIEWDNDSFGSMMCMTCIEKLRQAYNFRIQCLQADTDLQLFMTENDKLPQMTIQTFIPVSQDEEMQRIVAESRTDKLIEGSAGFGLLSHFFVQDPLGHDSDPLVTPDFPIVPKIITTPTISVSNLTTGPAEYDSLEKESPGRAEDENGHFFDTCGKKYAKIETLNRHKRTHVDSRKFVCKYCEKKFYFSTYLNIHIRRHTGEKPFQCLICLKRFTITAELNEHMRIHTEEKPYGCSCCEKRYVKASDLQVHLRSHTGKKPFSCRYCDQKFASGYILKSHLKTTHTDTGESWTCSLCDKTFTKSTHLTVHMKMHNEDKFACKVCDIEFTRSSQLMAHLRSHSERQLYKCDLCDKVCNYESELESHMMHGHAALKYFPCHACYEHFATAADLKEHVRTHTLFTCDNCERTFLRAIHLDQHLPYCAGRTCS